MSKRKKASEKHPRQVGSHASVQLERSLQIFSGALLIAVAALLAYLPAISGGFILDDNRLLTDNDLIKASDGLYRFWCTSEAADYWPVTNSSLWIEWRLWGMNPTGYHVTNLILHVVESLLIWVILRKLSIPGAFLAAMLFAVHPVNVESVAWIAQRKNTMAMLFFLLSILCYLNLEIASPLSRLTPAARHWPLVPSLWPLSIWYWLSLASFILAMLGKGSVAILPVLLLGIVWWRSKWTVPIFATGTVPIFAPAKMGLSPSVSNWSKRDLLRTSPFFAIAILLTIVNIWFQTHGTELVVRNARFTERLLGAGGVIWFYLYKALLPINLAFVYPQWRIEMGNPLWWLPLFAAITVTAVLWHYRKSWARPLFFAWGFFCLSLIPVLGFSDVGFMRYSLVADHYQHIAIIGPIILAAASWNAWQMKARGGTLWPVYMVAVVAVGLLTLLTWQQSELYQDPIALYQDTLDKNPQCWMAQNNLGLALENAGRPQKAIEYYQQALAIYPDFPDAHSNLGNALSKTGRLRESIEQYEQALRLKPDHTAAHNNLGAILVQAGRPEEAVKHYEQALRLKPNYPEAYNNLGNLMYEKSRMQDAIKYFQQALSLRSDYPEAQYNLANALVQAGRPQDAIEHYRQSMLLKPDQPMVCYSFGIALMQINQTIQAKEQFQQALRLKPDYTEAYFNLALAYAKTNQSAEAAAMAQKALDMARSQGQQEYIKAIEEWLNAYRGGRTNE